MKVTIIGNGAWGSAIASLFKENKCKFEFWKGERIENGSTIFCAVPAQAIREVLTKAGKPKNCIFINGSKGIEEKTHLLPYQIVKDVLEETDCLTLIGPSFANEIMQKMPTIVNLGYRKVKTAEEIKQMMQTDFFRIKLTESVRALELSASFKNIYAIACGVTQGLGFGINTRVKLILKGIEEIEMLREKLKFKVDKNTLPATIGDLILTCSSEESRNFSFGELLGKNPAEESLEKVGATVEGYYTAESVPYFEESLAISLPLAHFVYEVTHQMDFNIKKMFEEFVKNS